MRSDFLEAAQIVLSFDEGVEASPYKDTNNYWTIGIGRLIGRSLEDLRLSPAVIELMFEEDLEKHWSETLRFFGKDFMESLNLPRQIALLSLVYTLGSEKLAKFYSTVPAIRRRDWKRAGELLSKTQWAKDVDPKQLPNKGRDDRIIYMLVKGEFHGDYKLLG